MLANFY
jgi:hypothetical protein